MQTWALEFWHLKGKMMLIDYKQLQAGYYGLMIGAIVAFNISKCSDKTNAEAQKSISTRIVNENTNNKHDMLEDQKIRSNLTLTPDSTLVPK